MKKNVVSTEVDSFINNSDQYSITEIILFIAFALGISNNFFITDLNSNFVQNFFQQILIRFGYK